MKTVKDIKTENLEGKQLLRTEDLKAGIEDLKDQNTQIIRQLSYGAIKQGLFEHLTFKNEDLQKAMKNLAMQLATTKEELLQEKVKVREIENEQSKNQSIFEKIERELQKTIKNERNELEKVQKELKNKDFEYQLELKEVNAELDEERRKLSELSQVNQASLKMKDDRERKLCLEIEEMKELASRKEKEFAQLLTEKSAMSNKLKHNEIKHELFERLACKHENLQMAMNAIVKKNLADEKKEFSEIKGDLEDKIRNLENELKEANNQLRNKDIEHEIKAQELKAELNRKEEKLKFIEDERSKIQLKMEVRFS